MTSLALLLLAADPSLFLPRAELAVALVPMKAELTAADVRSALKRLSAKAGRGVTVEQVARAEYPGLSEESLRYTAADLSEGDRGRLARAPAAVSVTLTWPREDAAALRESYEALAAIAAPREAIIFDRNAASAYTVEAWKQRRVFGGWANGAVAGPMHFQVHMVMQDNGLVMLDTGGLPRFGIADFELLDVNRASIRAAGDLVNLVAQRLIEGARPDAKGRVLLRVADLKEAGQRERMKAKAYANGKGELVVGFTRADVSRGARDDALELTFPGVTGKDRGERLDGAVKLLFGTEDSTSRIDSNDPRVKAAKAKAAAALRTYEAKVKKGLPHDEVLMVKAPFSYEPDGVEWMWVDVESWSNGSLRGRLENEPEFVDTVKAGATVEVKLVEVMDYMYRFPDGSFLGNEVGRVMHPEMFELLPNGRARVVER